jgi:hypothetical protein
MWLPLLVALACGPEPVNFTVNPQPLAFGVVDIPPEMPDGGYATGVVEITNAGEEPAGLVFPAPDPEVFCIAGFPDDIYPVDFGEFAPGSTYALNVGLCGYPPGKGGNDLELGFDLETSGDPATITVQVTFTPNRITE